MIRDMLIDAATAIVAGACIFLMVFAAKIAIAALSLMQHQEPEHAEHRQ